MPKFEIVRATRIAGEVKHPGEVVDLTEEQGAEFGSYGKVKPFTPATPPPAAVPAPAPVANVAADDPDEEPDPAPKPRTRRGR